MTELRWVDLVRFGAKLEIVVDTTLQRRRLRLLIEDLPKWQATVFEEAPGTQAAALQSMGFVADPVEGRARFERAGGATAALEAGGDTAAPGVFYSDVLVPTRERLRALIPTLHDGDFVAVTPPELRGEPFLHRTAEEFVAAVRAGGQPLNFRFGAEFKPEAMEPGQYPKLWIPAKQQVPGADFYENARESNIAVSAGARSALRNPSAALLRQAWIRESDCYAALGLDASDRSAVREVDWPYQVPVARGIDDASVFVVPDARLLPCNLETAAHDGLLVHLQARERILSVAANVVATRSLASDRDQGDRRDVVSALKEVVGEVADLVHALGPRAPGVQGEPETSSVFAVPGRAESLQALAQRYTVEADRALVDEAIAVYKALDARGAEMERQAAVQGEDVAQRRVAALRGALREAYERGLFYNSEIRDFVAGKMKLVDDARPLDLGQIEVPDEVGGVERHRLNGEWTKKVAAEPRGAFARIGERRDGAIYWRQLMSTGDGGIATSAATDSANYYVPDRKLDFEAMYVQMVGSEVFGLIGQTVRQEMEREKDTRSLAELLAGGLKVTDTFKPVDGYIGGETKVSSVMVTAFDGAAGTVSCEFRQPRRPVQRLTIGAAAFQKGIGLSPAQRAPWQMTRDEYFHDEARVRRDVGADQRLVGSQERQKVFYAYDSPSPAGPFKGVTVAVPRKHAVGGSILATFGRATVTAVSRVTGDDPSLVNGFAVDRAELLELAKELHRRNVGDALAAGEIVPQKVLAEYPELVVATLREGSVARFTPNVEHTQRYGGMVEGTVIAVEQGDAGNGAQVRLMLDEFSPIDGQPVQRTVHVEHGRVEVVEQPKRRESKQPWEMTKTEWDLVRSALRPDHVQSRFTRASGAEAVARVNALEKHLFGVNDAESERHRAATRGEISIPRQEHRELLDRLQQPVSHRRVVEKALHESLPVPMLVLSEYPELAELARAQRSRLALAAAPPKADAVGTASDSTRIEDVGEKIGGARKDFYAKRMTVEDIASMNDFERRTLVSKKNVWPALDYEAMRRDGVEPQAAYAIKWIKDKINSEPPKVEQSAAYITAVGLVRDELESAKTLDDVRLACKRVQEQVGKLDPGTIGYSYTSRSQYHEALGRDAVSLISEPHTAIYRAGYRTAHNTSWSKLIRPVLDKTGDPDDQAKFRPERPHLDHLERKGVDWRRGRDVTGEELLETFGFRGIEYGNWLPQDERQTVLNHAHDAFMDLADAVGLPPKAMSLGNELAIAFGARGKGRHAAHFEPGRFVVNMTRLKGAGSVAHEWGHALDRWLAVTGKTAGLFMTGSLDSVTSASPPHLASAKKAMEQLSMKPIAIDDAIVKATDHVVNAAKRTSSGLVGWARHGTGFYGDEEKVAAGQTYASSVNALVANAFETLSAAKVTRAIEMGSLAALRVEFLDTRVPEKVEELYRLNGGSERSFFKKPCEQVRVWFQQPGRDLVRLERLLEAKAHGAVLAPVPNARRTANGEYLDLEHGKTVFHGAAKALDAKRKKPYYSEPEEMFARAFESFVFDEIAMRRHRSDYLVHGVEETRYAAGYAGNPYPVGAERQVFNANLREAMRSLRTELGKTVEHEAEEALAANL